VRVALAGTLHGRRCGRPDTRQDPTARHPAAALPNGNEIIFGIEFDRMGRRVADHFHHTHPGDVRQTGQGVTPRPRTTTSHRGWATKRCAGRHNPAESVPEK
jgi:capsid protein